MALASGSKIFIDSNIFIYHFLGIYPSCSSLLERAEKKDIIAICSVAVLSETLHRLMIAEAIEHFHISPRKVVDYLKKHPEKISQLTKAHEAIKAISRIGIRILPITRSSFALGQKLSTQYGLLITDAINLAVIQSHHIPWIATNDGDFQRVSHLHIWKP